MLRTTDEYASDVYWSPVGKAQKIILEALGLTAVSSRHADDLFAELGLVVKPVRQGRASVPRVFAKDRMAGGFTRDGDGETWQAFPHLTVEQQAALAPYLAK